MEERGRAPVRVRQSTVCLVSRPKCTHVWVRDYTTHKYTITRRPVLIIIIKCGFSSGYETTQTVLKLNRRRILEHSMLQWNVPALLMQGL